MLAAYALAQLPDGMVLDFWPRTGSGGWDPRGYSAALAFSLLLQLFIAARLLEGRR